MDFITADLLAFVSKASSQSVLILLIIFQWFLILRINKIFLERIDKKDELITELIKLTKEQNQVFNNLSRDNIEIINLIKK